MPLSDKSHVLLSKMINVVKLTCHSRPDLSPVSCDSDLVTRTILRADNCPGHQMQAGKSVRADNKNIFSVLSPPARAHPAYLLSGQVRAGSNINSPVSQRENYL